VIYIGIDPGASGGIAVLADEQHIAPTPVTFKLATMTMRDIVDTMTDYSGTEFVQTTAMIEQVNAFAAPGRSMGATSAFTFGKGYGALLMALTAAHIPFDQVVPRKWQAIMGVVYPKNSAQTERKNISKARAQQLFPKVTITHAIADALLIAEYGRRVRKGIR